MLTIEPGQLYAWGFEPATGILLVLTVDAGTATYRSNRIPTDDEPWACIANSSIELGYAHARIDEGWWRLL